MSWARPLVAVVRIPRFDPSGARDFENPDLIIRHIEHVGELQAAPKGKDDGGVPDLDAAFISLVLYSPDGLDAASMELTRPHSSFAA